MVKEVLMTDSVFLTDKELIVSGYPAADDGTHNCDEMGCGSCEHILLRIPLPLNKLDIIKGYNVEVQEREIRS